MGDILKDLLLKHEGLRLKPYVDTVGKTTIGIGRNLDDKGISEAEAFMMLDHDIKDTKEQVFKTLPWAIKLDKPRQAVVLSMAFNMGLNGLLDFKNMLAAVETGNYPDAAKHMLESKWAGQVGNRATYLSKIMETGQL
jgi:lysozyme